MNAQRKKAPWWRTPLIWVAAIIALLALIVWADAVTGDPARSEPSDGIAVGEVDGRAVAVVVYRGDTFPGIDLRRIDSIGISIQAEAFDLDTGERLWDTMLYAEFVAPAAQVLGMGSELVYVRSERGLLILDAATGELIASEGGIAGLGDDYIASYDAYAWDAPTRSVVLLDANGQVRSIAADSRQAVAASAEVQERWRDELNTGDASPIATFSAGDWDHTAHTAPLPDGQEVAPTWASPGWDVDVLLGADSDLAVGAEDGFAVTLTYQPDDSDATHLLQAGDLRTQRLLGTLEANRAPWAVVDSGLGHVVMLSGNDQAQGLLVVVTADGIRASEIGERGLLGW